MTNKFNWIQSYDCKINSIEYKKTANIFNFFDIVFCIII